MPNIALDLGKQVASFGVKSAYGEPQDVDGVSITPVALTWAGFGGGADQDDGIGCLDGDDRVDDADGRALKSLCDRVVIS